MSLSAWEQQALDSIEENLVGSDPQLVALLTTFAQLSAAEEMPVQETILARPRRSRLTLGRVNPQWAALLLWLVITAAMITVALILSAHSVPG